MYELHATVWTTVVLSQDVVGLAAKVMPTMRAGIVVLELTTQVITELRKF